MQRLKYHVVYTENAWHVKLEHSPEPISTHHTQDEAIKSARALAKQAELAQVIVHGKDGKIQTECTYGKDPKDIARLKTPAFQPATRFKPDQSELKISSLSTPPRKSGPHFPALHYLKRPPPLPAKSSKWHPKPLFLPPSSFKISPLSPKSPVIILSTL